MIRPGSWCGVINNCASGCLLLVNYRLLEFTEYFKCNSLSSGITLYISTSYTCSYEDPKFEMII